MGTLTVAKACRSEDLPIGYRHCSQIGNIILEVSSSGFANLWNVFAAVVKVFAVWRKVLDNRCPVCARRTGSMNYVIVRRLLSCTPIQT